MCKCASCDQLSFPFSAIILPQYLCNLQFKLINIYPIHTFKNKGCWENFCLTTFVQINLWAITNSGFHFLVIEHTSLGQTSLWLLQIFTHDVDTSSTNVDFKKLENQAPTYDDQFPTLGGGPGAPRAATAKPFGEWTNKPRVQSSTITQVMFACKISPSFMLGIFILIDKNNTSRWGKVHKWKYCSIARWKHHPFPP